MTSVAVPFSLLQIGAFLRLLESLKDLVFLKELSRPTLTLVEEMVEHGSSFRSTLKERVNTCTPSVA
jgi:hypothetical protein